MISLTKKYNTGSSNASRPFRYEWITTPLPGSAEAVFCTRKTSIASLLVLQLITPDQVVPCNWPLNNLKTSSYKGLATDLETEEAHLKQPFEHEGQGGTSRNMHLST